MKTWNDFYSLRAEFIVANRLIDRGVFFEFGAIGKPQPDLILRQPPMGIEVTRKHVAPVERLQRELREALWAQGLKPKIFLTYSTRPFLLRTKRRDEIIAEVIEAVRRGDSGIQAVVRPGRANQPAITVEIDLNGGRSVLPISRWKEGEVLTPSLLDVEVLITAAMEDKRKERQANSMPTILIVDITGIKGAETRNSREWGSRLGSLLKPRHKFIALAILIDHPYSKATKFALAANPHSDAMVHQWVNSLGDRLR